MTVEKLKFKQLSEVEAAGFEVNVLICGDYITRNQLFQDSEENGWAFVSNENEETYLFITYQRMITEQGEIDGPIIFLEEPVSFNFDDYSDMFAEASLQYHLSKNSDKNILAFIEKSIEFAKSYGFVFDHPHSNELDTLSEGGTPDYLKRIADNFIAQLKTDLNEEEFSEIRNYFLSVLR